MTRLNRLNWPRALPWLLTALLLLLLAEKIVTSAQAVGLVLRVTVVPLLLSLALSYLLQPVVRFFERHGLKRWQSVITSMLLAVVVIVLLAVFALPRIGAQLAATGQKLPTAVVKIASGIKPAMQRLHNINPAIYEKMQAQLDETLENPGVIVEPMFGSIRNGLLRVVDVSASILDLVLIPFFIYYILNEGGTWSQEAGLLIPPRYRASVLDLFRQVNIVASNFVRGQMTVYCVMSLLYIFGFLVLGVPMAFTLGILSGFGHLVPYVGTVIAAVITILVTVVDKPDLWRILALIGVYVVVQSMEGFLLTPRILGERLELHPFVVIIGILIGGSLFGILGIVLATPTIAIARVFLRFARENYIKSRFYNTQNLIVSDGVLESAIVLAGPIETVEEKKE
ncbi:MAG TPA: AI-2E family transporter [Blastocatellia bacterium]|nr:AI-2E family transporter [Blastocatellia bacterium]